MKAISGDLRVNDRIRAKQVRLVDAEGKQIGIIPFDSAKQAAQEAGLDLVEVSPDANPPVCKIMDYGKYKYRQKKKHHTKHHEVKVKEVRLRPHTDRHDIDVKLKKAREFIEKKDKVTVTLIFKGRELSFANEGTEILNRFVEAMEDIAKVENQSRLERKRMSVTLAPRQ